MLFWIVMTNAKHIRAMMVDLSIEFRRFCFVLLTVPRVTIQIVEFVCNITGFCFVLSYLCCDTLCSFMKKKVTTIMTVTFAIILVQNNVNNKLCCFLSSDSHAQTRKIRVKEILGQPSSAANSSRLLALNVIDFIKDSELR